MYCRPVPSAMTGMSSATRYREASDRAEARMRDVDGLQEEEPPDVRETIRLGDGAYGASSYLRGRPPRRAGP
jgi:hypothetical protein